MIILKVATEFSRIPGARTLAEGEFPAVDFREKFLLPKLQEAKQQKTKLRVDLDGSAGYCTSFLEESFGGLIRNKMFSYDDLKSILDIKSDDNVFYIEQINQYIEDAHKNESGI